MSHKMIAPSPSPVAAIRVFDEHVIENGVSRCPTKVRTALPVSKSQILTVLSWLPDRTYLPSRVIAVLTALFSQGKVYFSWPSSVFHTLTVSSWLSDVSVFSSGANATLHTKDLWPRRVHFSLRVETSQILAVPSRLDDASNLPSRENATQKTVPPCPFSLKSCLPEKASKTQISPS